jgi:outer membrane biosynthesis protein TonB
MEGWVTVRYSVLADGSTANVRAIDVVPPQLSASEALAAVEQWRFEPASLGGAAIDWYNNESSVLFGEQDVAAQAGPEFARS